MSEQQIHVAEDIQESASSNSDAQATRQTLSQAAQDIAIAASEAVAATASYYGQNPGEAARLGLSAAAVAARMVPGVPGLQIVGAAAEVGAAAAQAAARQSNMLHDAAAIAAGAAAGVAGARVGAFLRSILEAPPMAQPPKPLMELPDGGPDNRQQDNNKPDDNAEDADEQQAMGAVERAGMTAAQVAAAAAEAAVLGPGGVAGRVVARQIVQENQQEIQAAATVIQRAPGVIANEIISTPNDVINHFRRSPVTATIETAVSPLGMIMHSKISRWLRK